MKSFSFGQTPKEEIEAAAKALCPFSMELTGDDAKIVTELVNQGIDSHLEAIILAEPARLVGRQGFKKLRVVFAKEGMPCLLRRLLEHGSENAESLRSSILSELGIEEI